MTLEELHKTPHFAALFNDERFKAAVTHLRANFPANLRGKDNDMAWQGWYAALEAFEDLKVIPRERETPKRPAPYTKPETPKKS